MSFLTHPDNSNYYLSDPDVLLMVEFQRGNKSAFESLMRKYYGRILNFIYRFVVDRSLAEDLTQEVFLRVYKSAPQYKPKAKFQTWIFTIAKNVSFNELRKRKPKIVSLQERIDFKGDELQWQVADPKAALPDENMIKEERAREVQKAILSLPKNQKIAVLLRRYEDFSYEEIAGTLGCSVEAVKSLLSRAKENLKVKLSDYCKEKAVFVSQTGKKS